MNRIYIIVKDTDKWPDTVDMLRQVVARARSSSPISLPFPNIPYGAWYGTDYGYVEYGNERQYDHLITVINSMDGIVIDVERTL